MDSEQFLTPAQVAEQLQVSVDTIYRWFPGRRGVVNIGRPEKMHKRKYTLLRISRAALHEFLAEREAR